MLQMRLNSWKSTKLCRNKTSGSTSTEKSLWKRWEIHKETHRIYRMKKTQVIVLFSDQQFPPLTLTHLSDGCAELALKDLLQRLELVTGDITRLLQFLQQLDSSGHIWQREGTRGEKAPFNYIKLHKRCRSKSMGGIMETDLGQLGHKG